MTPRHLVNGLDTDVVSVADRGLQYGDGLFETMRIRAGRVQFLEDHLARLVAGCERLRIVMPAQALLLQEISMLAGGCDAGILKLVVTRGAGTRGYRPPAESTPTRILSLHAAPPAPAAPDQALTVRWCTTRIGRNPALAGIKHLNRLEQVMAQAEWTDPAVDEGLMLDTEGELVSATTGNLFLARDGILLTPDLRFCGVRGVLRGRVIAAAREAGLDVEEQALRPEDLLEADEVFLTNAVRGIRPVGRLDGRRWTTGPVTRQLAGMLDLW